MFLKLDLSTEARWAGAKFAQTVVVPPCIIKAVMDEDIKNITEMVDLIES